MIMRKSVSNQQSRTSCPDFETCREGAFIGKYVNCADHDKLYKIFNLGRHSRLNGEKLAPANPVKNYEK